MKSKLKFSVLLFLSLVLFLAPVYAEEEPLVNLFLFDTNIRDALSEISLQTGINIIPDQTVSGMVTADLEDVPLEKALRLLLIGGGYTYRKIDDFYFVGLPDPRSQTFQELVDTEVLVLQNVTVKQITGAMPDFLIPYVKGDPDSSILTITASPRELERIKAFVAQLDQPQQQVEIQVLITEVSNQAAREIGIDLWEYTAAADQRFNETWEGTFEFIGNLLTLKTDVYGKLLAKLRLLEEQREATIHADPKIIVANKKEAKLFIGDKQILLVQTEETTSTRIERLEVGVNLKVVPVITGANDIVLEITPEISHFVNETKSNLIVKESALTTTVRLRSGQTALLAGMTVSEMADYNKKVPVLGNIPILRWLFKTEVKKESDRELLIFVTPVIK